MAAAVRQVRWGIVGCGLISGDMVKAIKLLPPNEHEIVAVAASAVDRAQSFAVQNGVQNAKAYGTYDQLFADPNVEVIYVGVLNHQHKSVVLKALDSGKHVLCEKPLGLNVKDTREMVDKARSKKLFLMEGYWSRFFPVWKQMKHELEQNSIGHVSVMQCDFGFVKHEENKMTLALGGGNLMATGCYSIMLALSIFGVERPEQITAIGFKSGSSDESVDDTASITLKFSGNRLAQLLYTGSSDTLCQVQICGNKGRLHIPHHFWCPDTLIKYTLEPEPATETKTYPIPTREGVKFRYPNSGGLSYEAGVVRDCIINGRTECPDMTLDETVLIAEILQEIRRQLGVKYPQDDE